MTFADDVARFRMKALDAADHVYGRAVELLGDELTRTRPQGGRVPFLTGNLARSLMADKTAMPMTAAPPFVGGNIGLLAATLKANEPVFVGYQARYAWRVNYGFVGADRLGRVYNQHGANFVEAAAAEWSNIVRKAVAELKQ